MFGANPLVAPQAVVPLMSHVKDHLMSLWKAHASAAADSAYITGEAQGEQMKRANAEELGLPIAEASLAKLLGPLMPLLQQAQALARQYGPKPPVDPTAQAQMGAQAQAQQATLAAQAQQAQQALMAQAHDKQMTLQAQAMEADKDRQHKFQIKQMELEYEARQAAAQADQNDRATVMATSIEKQTLDVQSSLEQFKADVAAQAQARENEALAQRQQMKAEADAQLMVLSETLKSQAASFQQEPIDVAGIVQPIVQEMQTNTLTMLQQLQEGLTSLHETHKAPRIARYIKDELGNNIGVESVVKEF